jgi:hypothetical protein
MQSSAIAEAEGWADSAGGNLRKKSASSWFCRGNAEFTQSLTVSSGNTQTDRLDVNIGNSAKTLRLRKVSAKQLAYYRQILVLVRMG